jgi:hypothetical protein
VNSRRRTHIYEVRPRKDHRGVDLISDALPLGRLCYGEPNVVTQSVTVIDHAAKIPMRGGDEVLLRLAALRLSSPFAQRLALRQQFAARIR